MAAAVSGGHRADLRRGSVAWFDPDPVSGCEQGGRRPALVVATDGYLAAATTLTIVLPITTTDRGWPNHIRLRGRTGLDRASFAMTEQPRTIDRGRIASIVGHADEETMREVERWLRMFLGI